MTFASSAEGNRVSAHVSPMPSPILISAHAESRWLSWGRSAAATLVAIVLIALGTANIVTRAQWAEVEDGVHWDNRSEGVAAIEVARDSAAAVAGIMPGDILLAVDGQ